MKQAVKNLLLLVIVLAFGANLFAQNNLVKVADGRDLPESPKASESETEFIKKEVKSKEQAIKDLAKSKGFKCDEDNAEENLSNENVTANLAVYGGFDGAFTKAKEMIYSAKKWKASEMKEAGLIHEVCNQGEGVKLALEKITKEELHAHDTFSKICTTVPLEELISIVEIWIENVMNLDDFHIKTMQKLIGAQKHKSSERN